jgi:hypothetical protein
MEKPGPLHLSPDGPSTCGDQAEYHRESHEHNANTILAAVPSGADASLRKRLTSANPRLTLFLQATQPCSANRVSSFGSILANSRASRVRFSRSHSRFTADWSARLRLAYLPSLTHRSRSATVFCSKVTAIFCTTALTAPQTISSVAGSHRTVRCWRYEAMAIWQAVATRYPRSNGQTGSLRLRTQSKKFCRCAVVKSL